MPDKPTFVVNDRRKFTAEGELRHDLPSDATSAKEAPSSLGLTTSAEPARGPQLVSEPPATAAALADLPESQAIGELYPEPSSPADLHAAVDTDFDASFASTSPENFPDAFSDDASLPPGPTPEQAAEATRAYDATVDRLDTAMRAANPGCERLPPMDFNRLVQSLYTQALILLGGGAQPGETPRVDILGAKETIDMLSVLADKSQRNLSPAEDKLLQSALFDLRMGFLEITQALARQAAGRQPAPGMSGAPTGPGGPRIVR